MVDRYWVLGPGTWDATQTTHWAASSGGAKGASAPKAADNVFFDANSGLTAAQNVLISGVLSCASLNCTGFTGTLAITTSSGLTVLGNLTLSATTTIGASSGAPLAISNQTTNPITIATNGATVKSKVTVQGAGTTSPINIASFTSIAGSATITSNLVFTNCTVNLPAAGITCDLFGTSGAVNINFGSSGTSFINVTSGGTAVTSVTTAGTLQSTYSGTQRPVLKLSYAGTAGTRTVSDYSNAFDYVWYGGGKTVFNGRCKTLDLRNFTGVMNTTGLSYISEDLLTASNVFAVAAGTSSNFTFNGAGTQNISTAGFPLPKSVSFAGTGTYVFQSNATVGQPADVGAFSLATGTVNLNGKTITCTNYTINGICGLTFNSGKFVVTGTTSAWIATGSTITCSGPGIIELTSTATGKLFRGADNAYNGVTLTLSGAGITNIYGSNTFASIKNTVAPLTAVFENLKTTIFTDAFELNGTPAAQIEITGSSVSGSVVNAPNFAKPSGTVVCSYANIRWNNAGYTGSPATSGFTSTWTTGPKSVLGTTTGWSPASGALNFLPIFYP